MGSITERKGRYTALIRIKRGGRVVHAEAQTFSAKRDAANWMKRREAELHDAPLLPSDDPALADVLVRYASESLKQAGRTKQQVLRTIGGSPLGRMRCSRITSADIVKFAGDLDCLPQTRANYLAHLGTVFSVAAPAWGYPLSDEAMRHAKIVCKKLGLTGATAARNRRPDVAELDKLLDWFDGRERGLPMSEVVLFALFSTRRQDEIRRIVWDDLIPARQSVIVRDMKNPGQKIGNDVEVHLPDEAWRLVMRQPRGDARIFPYSTDAIGAAFTRACRMLGIEDLHFHDLRHDGVSRLFELGWDIPRVASVSGHKNWETIRRYTHLRGTGDKYEGWIRRP